MITISVAGRDDGGGVGVEDRQFAAGPGAFLAQVRVCRGHGSQAIKAGGVRMGVFYDYYRAANRQAAVEKPDYPRVVGIPGRPAFDTVESKWFNPWDSLSGLIAVIRNVPYSSDLVRTVELYPPPENAPKTDQELAALPEDSPYLVGPGMEELPVDVRDTLADVSDGRLGELGERWAAENGSDPDSLAGLIAELRDLARRARDEDQSLYCWSFG
ncbi:hypothetical protein [Nonomuraea fuscirosea]|nr:hypothetical protein [Nonomuraea fuscirosea]